MKLNDIKSKQVLKEAVKLSIAGDPETRTMEMVLDYPIIEAFDWKQSLQGVSFWGGLYYGTIPNTPSLKLARLI